jgi:hypothetical protein
MGLNSLLFDVPWSTGQFTTEARFSTWYGKQLKDRGGMYHKISDESRWMKPCDSIFAFDWLVWIIEFKVTKKKTYKPYMLLRGSSVRLPGYQIKWLDLYQKNGWLSLVAVYNKLYETITIIDFAALVLNPDLTIWEKGIPCKTSGVLSLQNQHQRYDLQDKD